MGTACKARGRRSRAAADGRAGCEKATRVGRLQRLHIGQGGRGAACCVGHAQRGLFARQWVGRAGVGELLNFVQKVIGQVFHLNLAAVAHHDHGGAQEVVQLAEVARPAVLLEHRHDAGRHADVLFGRAQVEQNLVGHHFKVRAFAQGGQAHHQAVQAVVQVFAELALGDQGFEVFVGGANEHHVHLVFLARAQRCDPALLQHAQQTRLQLGGHVADFVQKQRAAVRHLDLAGGATPFGTGERAFFVAKEFGLDQGFRNGGAVDRHKGPPCPCRVVVDGLRQDVFAGAGFTQDHDRDVAALHPLQLVQHGGHLRVAGVQVVQARQAGAAGRSGGGGTRGRAGVGGLQGFRLRIGVALG